MSVPGEIPNKPILACDRHLKSVTELKESKYRNENIIFCWCCGKYWKMRDGEPVTHQRGKKLFLSKVALARLNKSK